MNEPTISQSIHTFVLHLSTGYEYLCGIIYAEVAILAKDFPHKVNILDFTQNIV